MDFLTSNSMLMMEKSMGFLWTKQAAIADNVTNAETPNYKTKIVRFEESLKSKISSAASGKNAKKSVRNILEDSEFSVVSYDESKRMDDNSVDTTEQMVELVRNSYQMQYLIHSINMDLSMLRSAARGQ